MNDVVRVLAEHPFIPTEQMARLLGVGERHVRRLLAPLIRRGVVATVAPRLPGRPLRLYYPRTPSDAKAIALHPDAAGRYLYRAGLLYALRDFLADLPFEWEEMYPAPGRRGLLFHALVRAKTPVVVEWDTGLLPRPLFRHRIRRLVQSAPALLVFTSPPWTDETMRLLSRGRIPTAVAPIPSPGRKEGEEAVTVYAIPGGRKDLLTWLHELPHNEDYPRRRLFFEGGWNADAQRFVALSPRQKEILSLVVALPFISPVQAADLTGMRPLRAARVLRTLGREGWLTEEQGRYLPTRAALALMAKMAGSSLHGYAKARRYRLHNGHVDVPVLRATMAHTLEGRFLAAGLARALGPGWTWYDEREAVITFHYHGSWRLSPDARVAGERMDLFLEVDRRGPSERVRRKLIRYGFYRKAGGRPFVFLVVAETPHRVRRWLDEATRTVPGLLPPPFSSAFPPPPAPSKGL